GGPHALGRHTRLIHGTGESVSGSGFVLTTGRYGDVNVTLPTSTSTSNREPNGHGRRPQTRTAAPVRGGGGAVVLGRTSADGKSFVARRVQVLGARQGGATRTAHLVGTVVSASATSITVKLADGTSQTVSVAGDVKIKLDGKTVADLVAGT